MNKQVTASAFIAGCVLVKILATAIEPAKEEIIIEVPKVEAPVVEEEKVCVEEEEESIKVFAEPKRIVQYVNVPMEVEQEETEQWFSDDYLSKNIALKNYADEYASFNFHGVEIDGLAVMAQANTESAYMCDTTQSLSALYPTVFVDFDNEDDIASLGIDKVWSSKDALNGTYVSKPGWCMSAGPYYAWSSGDGIYEQGPLQTRIAPCALEALEGYKSEEDKLYEAGLYEYAKNTQFGYEATALTTGSDYLKYCLGYETYGDRWAVADNCIIYRETKEGILNTLWDRYYANCGYTPNKYEYLAILAYAHWIPGVIQGDSNSDAYYYYGFQYDGAWFDLSHQLSSDEAMNVIREHARTDIDANRALMDEGYTKDECNALIKLAMPAGSTYSMEKSEPWQIFEELASKGIVDRNTVLISPQYTYQHAMKYAIQYLYAYTVLEELLINNY